MAAKRAPKQPADERRKTILAGAQEVFAGASYAQADTNELAAAAGVKPAALYRYFPTKRDLYLATLADAGPKLLRLWEQGLERAEDPLEAMRSIGMAYYDHAEGRSPTMRLWFQAVGEASDPEVREVVGQTIGGAVALLKKNLEAGMEEGLVRADLDVVTAAWHFMAIGFAMDLIHQLGFNEELNRERVAAWGKLYLDSIRAEAVTDGTTRTKGKRGSKNKL